MPYVCFVVGDQGRGQNGAECRMGRGQNAEWEGGRMQKPNRYVMLQIVHYLVPIYVVGSQNHSTMFKMLVTK